MNLISSHLRSRGLATPGSFYEKRGWGGVAGWEVRGGVGGELQCFPLAGLVAGQEKNLPSSCQGSTVDTPSCWRGKMSLFLFGVIDYWGRE